MPSYRRDFFTGLSKMLKNSGFDLEVLHGMPTDKKIVVQDDSCDYEKRTFLSQVKKIGPLKFTNIKQLFEYVKRKCPDAIVISYMSTNLSMLKVVLYCIIKKIPYATWRCGYNRPDYTSSAAKLRQIIIGFVEKKASLNICYGSYYKNALVDKGIPHEKIIIAQNTINVEKILEENKNHKKIFSVQTKILFVGALIKGKLLKSSIDAVKMLIDEGFDVCFDIVGGGEMLEELKQYSISLNLDGKINMVGPKYGEEVKNFFRNADVFLLAGTGGLAVNQAMAYGLPIISTNADGTVCDLIDGNGYYMDKFGDTEIQYQCLGKFIALSNEEKVRMSEKSKQIIGTKATLENMINKHREACVRLLSANE